MTDDDRARAYLEAAPDAIVVIDERGCIEYASRRGHALLGARSQLRGRELREFIDPEDAPKLVSLRAPKPPRLTELRLAGSEGEVEATWVEATSEVVPDGVSGPAFVLALRDITGRKRAEHDLRAAKSVVEQANQRLAQAMRDLERLAATDELTGLWNRRHFEQVASVELSRCHRYGHVASLIVLDVDHFKSVNDRFGHEAGDRALVAVCKAIAATARGSDTACRWGGEEFVVLASSVSAPGAWRLAERIRVAVGTLDPPAVPGGLTISAGVAQLRPTESLESWVERADKALYRAKEGGRNRVEAAEHGGDALEGRLVQLVWDSSFECGDSDIDEQHRELFLLGNDVLDAAMASAPVAQQLNRLGRLLDHVTSHFAYEEKMLERIGYADRERHAAVHRSLVEEVSRLRSRLVAGELMLPELVTFLVVRVVHDHLVHVDSQFFGAVAAAR
jgi:diguanylate cyclase (GGDEF)-like protein/hemerythrin-like metal-binding protein/PAS domain S-box-containing protein